MDAAAELRGNPVISNKHQIQPEYGDEQADAGRDCRTRLAIPNSQARSLNADREISIFHVQLTTYCRIGNLTRLSRIVAVICICVTIHNVGEKPTVLLHP